MEKQDCKCGSTTFVIYVDSDQERIVPKCALCGEEWADLDYKQ